MFRGRQAALAAASIMLLAGCDEMELQDYADRGGPALKIEEYFDGHTRAWGLFTDRFGRVRRQFAIDLEGRREGDTLILKENFVYGDGERQERVWTIQKTGPTTYTGNAADVIGIAAGESLGPTLRLRYDMALPVDGDVWEVGMDDWLFLQPDGETLLSQVSVTRWGVEIGRIHVTFRREQPAGE